MTTTTATTHLMASFPGQPGQAGTRKVKSSFLIATTFTASVAW